MPSRASRVLRAAPVVLATLGVARLAPLMRQVAARTSFPYDFVTWADDYVLTELVKLRRGAALYGTFQDANSFIYAPGLPLLHRALLGPMGLDLSVVANRVLSQAWLVSAALVALVVARDLVDSAPHAPRLHRAARVVAAFAALLLAGYASPVADSMHPGNLELLVLTVAALALARFPRLGAAARIGIALALPAIAFTVKQSAGSVAVAIAIAALASPGRRRLRLGTALAALVSAPLAIAALQIATSGGFGAWALFVPTHQPLEPWRIGRDLPRWSLGVAPVLLLAAASVALAARRFREPRHAALLRVALVPIAYAPFALVSLAKVLGGTNNLASIAFFATLLAMPLVARALDVGFGTAAGALVAAAAIAQLLLLGPHFRVPRAEDFEAARSLCSFVAARARCGERVWLDQGSACLADAGGDVPLDRDNAYLELRMAGLDPFAATAFRVERETYDVIALHAWSPPYYAPSLLALVAEHYQPFATIPPGQQGGDLWTDGWQNLQPPTILLERRSVTPPAPRVGGKFRHHGPLTYRTESFLSRRFAGAYPRVRPDREALT
jgi:hypothetical protein